MASSLVFRQSHRLILLFALAGTASLGSASLGPAQAQSNDPATTINDGLQAYYSFDEAGHDDSPWGRNITIAPPLRLEQSGGVTTLKLSEPNAFLKLGQLDFPRHPQGYSVAGWVKLDQGYQAPSDVARPIFAGLWLAQGKLSLTFGFDTDGNGHPYLSEAPLTVSNAPPPGRWTHLALTYDGPSRMLRFYMDGAETWSAAFDSRYNISNYQVFQPVFPTYVDANFQTPDPTGQHVLHGNVDKIMLHDRVLTPQEVKYLANRGNVAPPDYVVRFAPELRFTRDSASQGYPMSAQPFFDHLTKDSNGYPVAMPGDAPVGVENTDNATLRGNTIPTYFMERITSPQLDFMKHFAGTQVRINYWWFYGYQHPCTRVIGGAYKGNHNGDWEHVTVILKEDRSAIAAISYYQHDGHYTRISVGHGPCTPAGTGRCGGSGGFEMDGTHPVVYIGRMAHGGYHDTNRWLPGADRSAPSKDPLQCAYYGDIRDPGSAADNFDSSRKLIDLDGDKEAWLAKDRAPASWNWGPDGISNHPTQKSPLDDEHRMSCEGRSTAWFQSDGCYKSECLAEDDEASEDCLKECEHGYNNVGLTCNKGVAPWDWKIYGRLTGGHSYGYRYTLPDYDAGLARRRTWDWEWNLP
jgi:Concanavalin A-like lectin/glucanases superfamily